MRLGVFHPQTRRTLGAKTLRCEKAPPGGQGTECQQKAGRSLEAVARTTLTERCLCDLALPFPAISPACLAPALRPMYLIYASPFLFCAADVSSFCGAKRAGGCAVTPRAAPQRTHLPFHPHTTQPIPQASRLAGAVMVSRHLACRGGVGGEQSLAKRKRMPRTSRLRCRVRGASSLSRSAKALSLPAPCI